MQLLLGLNTDVALLAGINSSSIQTSRTNKMPDNIKDNIAQLNYIKNEKMYINLQNQAQANFFQGERKKNLKIFAFKFAMKG